MWGKESSELDSINTGHFEKHFNYAVFSLARNWQHNSPPSGHKANFIDISTTYGGSGLPCYVRGAITVWLSAGRMVCAVYPDVLITRLRLGMFSQKWSTKRDRQKIEHARSKE